MDKIACTAAILTFNSEKTLGRTLESVRRFGEVIVCDGGSTDETVSIALKFGAKLLRQDEKFKNRENKIVDFSGVRNQTLEAASNEWFCFIDSDEVFTDRLVGEMAEVIARKESAAFWIDRKYEIDGRIIDCAATYPTRQMRFFNLRAVNRFIKPIHERIEVRPGEKTDMLKNFMLVPVSADPKVWRTKWAHYIALESSRRGRITFRAWLSVCLENLKISALYAFRFVRNLIFCRGFRMPWRLEWERHVYNFNLCRALWKNNLLKR